MSRQGPKYFLLSVVLLLLWTGGASSQPSSEDKIQLLENPQNHEWCAYRDESEWMSDVDSLTARNLGRLVYSGGRLKEIFVTQQHETEDWSVEDRYFVGPQGALERLSRIIEILPGDRRVKEIYLIRGGKALRQTREVRSLSTDKPASLGDASLPQVAVKTNALELPFAAFVVANRFSGLSAGKVCLPANR